MSLAAYKDLCLDAHDAVRVGEFWARLLGQEVEELDDGDAVVTGPQLADLWINTVPEPKKVKNRVHLDVRAPDLDAVLGLGASAVAHHDGWAVVADPEGNELCVFPGAIAGGAAAEVFALCVDSARPVELAAWWHRVIGGEIGPGSDGDPRWLHGAAGLGGIIMKFVRVADRRTTKNRCHWDVTTPDVGALVGAGATVRAELERWTVLTDPDGNEFCAFAAPPS